MSKKVKINTSKDIEVSPVFLDKLEIVSQVTEEQGKTIQESVQEHWEQYGFRPRNGERSRLRYLKMSSFASDEEHRHELGLMPIGPGQSSIKLCLDHDISSKKAMIKLKRVLNDLLGIDREELLSQAVVTRSDSTVDVIDVHINCIHAFAEGMQICLSTFNDDKEVIYLGVAGGNNSYTIYNKSLQMFKKTGDIDLLEQEITRIEHTSRVDIKLAEIDKRKNGFENLRLFNFDIHDRSFRKNYILSKNKHQENRKILLRLMKVLPLNEALLEFKPLVRQSLLKSLRPYELHILPKGKEVDEAA